MAYRRNDRNVYDDRFINERPGPYPRAAGAVERRVPYRPEEDYGRSGYASEGAPRFFPNGGGPRNYHGEDRAYHADNVHFPAERRTGPASRRQEEYPYPAQRVPREDPHPGRTLEFNSRAPPHTVRNQGIYPAARALPESGEDTLVQAILNLDRGRKAAQFSASIRERSPVRREVARSPHSRSGSSVSSRGYSPDRAKNLPFPAAQSKNKIPGLSREGSPHSASPSKEESHLPEAEPEEKVAAPAVNQEEVPKSTESFLERRAMAIATKAQEIEKVYRQDCETFGMVVKLLVAKDPNLEKQLQVPLRENLGEIRERCLEDLKQFITELDEVTRQPEPVCDSTTPTTTALTSHKLNKTGLNHSSSF
ncbi:periphilin-1 isoform X3 [Periophthalmus magnuspinnatus]|uniref:periphilin-1 isoform X3 n=1 Tax=Periophthalmus magnuspinnatus TaxID=409849 RepID=UPI00243712C3|nr:periphilin-1 isoform X3 [Periophthalmus magnuspinnatus]XP_055087898.1 periphilin-1 isoform X3 [Periophthalmus magnuspinnatus]